MLWTSIVSYFTDSSVVGNIYAFITLIILKESFDNQKVRCMPHKNVAFKEDINEVCENRRLYNYSTKWGYYDEDNNQNSRDYVDSIENKTININDFTSDRNYFNAPYIYGIHLVIILSTRGIYLRIYYQYHFI